ncbi:MAG: hypothetical protein U0800_00435 [Isosphaeraceae bacterium]
MASLPRRARAGDRPGAWRERLASAGIVLATADPACSAIDRVRPADEYELDGVAARRVREGWGLPLVAFRDLPGDADDRGGVDRFLPNQLATPATAWIRADPSGAFVLELGDPGNARPSPSRASGRCRWRPISPPPDGGPPATGLAGVRAARRGPPRRAPGEGPASRCSPLPAGKIPVLLVHGLWSEPQTWLSMLDELEADPAIRGRYQFWVAFYATGCAAGRRLADPATRWPASATPSTWPMPTLRWIGWWWSRTAWARWSPSCWCRRAATRSGNRSFGSRSTGSTWATNRGGSSRKSCTSGPIPRSAGWS